MSLKAVQRMAARGGLIAVYDEQSAEPFAYVSVGDVEYLLRCGLQPVRLGGRLVGLVKTRSQ